MANNNFAEALKAIAVPNGSKRQGTKDGASTRYVIALPSGTAVPIGRLPKDRSKVQTIAIDLSDVSKITADTVDSIRKAIVAHSYAGKVEEYLSAIIRVWDETHKPDASDETKPDASDETKPETKGKGKGK